MRRLVAALALLVPLLLAGPAPAQDPGYGETTFENSGADAAQDAFLRGLLMLHSFEYAEARRAFQAAQETDPDFALAHWGEAMTHNHPIWMEQDREAALDALRDLAPTPEGRLEAAPTERETAYLRTVHVLYGAGTDDPKSKEARDDAYAAVMADLAAQYPDDLDAQAFHALALLGTAHEGRDFETYMRAAAIVEEVFDENPQHPGAAHYLIHAYDDPVHAPLGLRPARVYADIAPAAPHALHMPSHIFFALGKWSKGAQSNVDAYEAAAARAEAPDDGLSGGGFHALHWLHYARLQQGRHEDARSVLDTATAHVTDPAVSAGYATFMRWYLPVAYVVETRQWGALGSLLDGMNVPVDSLDARGAVTRHVGRGLAAVRQGNRSQAQSALTRAKSALGDADDPDLRIQVHELEGLIALESGSREQALAHLDSAATLEAERPLDFGPPFPPKPAHELYGEVLLELDRPADALAQFRTALDRYPGRALSLMGTAEAASRAGKTDGAQEARTALTDQWDEADPNVRKQLQSLLGSAQSSAADPE
jgi:tetratricopeptide (TPR) repeat protein